MKISIIGAGPAGLYFAILMRQADPSHDVVVYERDGADDTFGWGIVFSDQTFAYLRDSDEPSFHEIISACQTWDSLDVVHRGEKMSIHGNRFSGIARIAFLKILQRRATALGVDLRYHTPIADAAAAGSPDLLVAADGANSVIRQQFASAFHPEVSPARNKYIWLGTTHLFSGLTLSFHETEWGPFAAHAYRFSPAHSTFIVECGHDAWERAGFASMSEAETLARLQSIFAADLQGAPLLTNNFVRWLNFTLVKNRRWWHDRVVLLGDALHTAHFSIGSGTKLALEDAIALAKAFAERGDVSRALPYFEEIRRPVVDAIQDAALESLRWFENMGADFHLDPLPFAYKLMTRSGRIDKERLRLRDPLFVDAYERAVAR